MCKLRLIVWLAVLLTQWESVIADDPLPEAGEKSTATQEAVESSVVVSNVVAHSNRHSAGMLGDQEFPETLRLNSVANYVRYDVATLVRNHKASGKTTEIDTVVLGCTHFPLVRHEPRVS